MDIGRITFKSFPKYWAKEKKGIKNNTLREVDYEDDRFKLLDKYNKSSYNTLQIKIVNSDTNKSFVREIRDVTYYKNYVVITWSQ